MPHIDHGDYTLVGRIYDELLEQIMRGQTSATLSESKLAKRFGTSKTPVREALQRLASDGIVSANPKRGWQVETPNLRELRDLFVVSAVLEGFAAYQAAHNATKSEIDQLFRVADLIVVTDDQKSVQECAFRNYQFHNLISKAAHNPVLESHIRVIVSRIQLALLDAHLWSDPSFLENGHKHLTRCLTRKDAVGAKSAMERQIEMTMQRLLMLPNEASAEIENPEELRPSSKVIRI